MLAGDRLWLEENTRDTKAREVRLGLVLYGGISLAIYINGVAQEFFRAVHGSGVYRLIKALTDSDIIVDVISGTSAGGMNGVLLSYALCNNKNFTQASALWREHGSISKLLRSPDQTNPLSLLNSEGYYQLRLEEAFADMEDYSPEPDEDCSAFDELDLFVTGTDVDGNIYTQFDDAGHSIDVKDHRSVFLLKHRRGRKEPFNPVPNYETASDPQATYEALGKLAYITSCFPGAFAPVHVARTQPGDESADGKLQMWGRLGKDAYLLDGGVLDNKPFTYTTKAIFSRNADRDVERKLFYVEPSPESFHKPERASQLNFLQVILASLIGIPSYETIADDLKLLAEHNSKLLKYQRLVADLQPLGGVASTGGAEGSQPAAIAPQAAQSILVTPIYRRSRLVFISEQVVQGLLKIGDLNARLSSDERKQAAKLAMGFDHLVDDLEPSAVDRLFADFDVYYRLRRLTRVVYLIFDLLYNQPSSDIGEQAGRYRKLWRALNRQIELLEIVRAAMESLVDRAPINWRELRHDQLWATVQTALYCLLDAQAAPAQPLRAVDPADPEQQKQWLPPDVLQKVHGELDQLGARIVDELQHNACLVAPASPHTLLAIVDQHEQALLAACVPEMDDPVRQAYDRFAELDAQLFPLEVVGDLHEKDVIETVRISPRDAQKGFSRNGQSDKLSGDTLYHFGAFFKRSWRSNDILWGRLDGLCQLVESLLSPDRLAQIVADDAWRTRVRARFFIPDHHDGSAAGWNSALDPAVLFPNAGSPTHTKCREWLEQLFSDDPLIRQQALDSRFDEMIELIIEAAQLEVLNRELPNVINDAITEQSEWNQYQVQQGTLKQRRSQQPGDRDPAPQAADQKALAVEYDPLPWVFRGMDKRLDPFVAIVAAAEMTRTALDRLSVGSGDPARPSATRLGAFFRSGYRVGAEQLTRDIPALVLLDILATTLLVLRNCILALFGPNAERIRHNPFYFFGLNLPLTAFYTLVRLSRRAPGWGIGTLIGLIVISILALVVGCVWSKQLIATPGGISFVGLAVFILAPLGILFIVASFLDWTRLRSIA